MALFMTPEQVTDAEGQSRVGVGSRYREALAGSLFNLGHTGGDTFQRGAFGTDTRTQAVKDAQFITQTVKQVDFSQPDTIIKVANELNDAGFVDQAFKFLSAVPPSAKAPEQWSEPYFETMNVGDTTKTFRMQKNQYGQVRNIGEVRDTESDGPAPAGIDDVPQSVYDQIQMTDLQKKTHMARLKSDPVFKSMLDDTSEEVDLLPAVGEIESVANQLKTKKRNEYLAMAARNEIPYTAIPALLNADGGDDRFIREGFNKWKAGDGWKESLEESTLYGGATPVYRGDRDTSDLATLEKQIALNDARAKAVADVAARTDQLVYGDPEKGEFRLKALGPTEADRVFSSANGVKDDEEIRQELENRGFRFTPDLFRVHAQRWQIMRENPQVAAMYLKYADDPDLQEARKVQYLDELDEIGDVQRWATAQEIFRYLDRLQSSDAKKKVTAGRYGGAVQ